MSDSQGSPLHFDEEDRLPWLEPVEDDQHEGGSGWRLAGIVIAGLLFIGLVVGGMWWLQTGGRARGELIAADETPYKNAPAAEPGRFEGEGAIAVAAAEGVQPTAKLDPNRLPEQPIAPPVATGRPAPAATPATKAPAAATPAATPAPVAAASGSGMVQLGAFSSSASAQRAWTSLKGRFAYLEPVNSTVVTAEVNGRTVYRLQAAAGSASAAQSLCNRLRVAGENCMPVR